MAGAVAGRCVAGALPAVAMVHRVEVGAGVLVGEALGLHHWAGNNLASRSSIGVPANGMATLGAQRRGGVDGADAVDAAPEIDGKLRASNAHVKRIWSS